MEGCERGARAAGLKASNRCLARRHAGGKVALCQPRGFSRVADLLSHLQSQASRGEGLVKLDALVSAHQVASAFTAIETAAAGALDGILVQPQINKERVNPLPA